MDRLEPKNVNVEYFVHYVKQFAGWRFIKVLDFGCGEGEIVKLLRQEGVECFGTDIFYGGAKYAVFNSDLFQNGIIRAIPDGGVIPFENAFFDVIISNQVFEHIEDKESVLKELNRVLKDDGIMRHHFPTRELIREGHMGIPFSHWLPKGRLRYFYTVLLRSTGLGFHKKGLPARDWAKRKLEWLDMYCYYISYADMQSLFSKEHLVFNDEINYCRFRARNNLILRALLGMDFMKEIYQRLFRRLGFVTIELRKRNVLT